MTAEKLSGFTSFKATCVLKLQVNSQPFQCGRLLMAAAPMPGLLGNRRQFIFSHVSNAQNLNHVQMDIAKDTEVELRIPFISPYNCFDLIDGKFDWAEVRILVYSPLNSVGGTCIQCLVYGHFEDIEMGAPTSGGIKQQSMMPSKKAVDSTKRAEARGGFTGALAQLGSSLINKGATSLISALGWSKPILAKPSRVFLNRPTEGFQYMDGVDHSLVLGMTASNQVEPIPGLVGTNVDETSFDTLKRIPQMIGVFTYSDKILTCSQDNRDPVYLWECAVSPSTYLPACYYVVPPATGTNVRNPYSLHWKQPTTLNYITSPFLYWTGSLVYTFKFIKTDYHSGRIEISFHPFVNTVDPDRMDYVYRTVIDLRKNSEVSVTIPYIAAQPWKRISTFLDPVNPDPPAPGRLKDVIAGIIYVRALTPLICANSIIASDIECVVEMRAGDDFEVAGPITSKFMPFSFQNPTQQSGAFCLKQPARMATIRTLWDTQDIANRQRVFTGIKDIKVLGVEVFCCITQWNDVNSSWQWSITYSLDNNNPVVFSRNDRNMYVHHYTVLNNSDSLDTLTVTWSPVAISPAANSNNSRVQVNISVYEIKSQADSVVRIDQSQLPLPIASEGSGGIVKIDPTTLPLPVTLEELVNVHIEDQPIDVKIDKSQIPLETTGGGGGGESGKYVTIDPCQLPLWTSDYNVAPKDPRQMEPCSNNEQQSSHPRQQAGQIAAAGVTETRTRAIEGWLPPSITGSAKDGHRPSTVSLCMGEKFTSFRQYAKRFAFCMVNSLSSSVMMSIQPVELIRPGGLFLRPTEASTGNNERTQLALYTPNTKAEVSGSPLSFVASMYAFYRGSTRFKVWMDPRENPPNLISGHLEYTRQITDSNVIDDNIENFMTPIAYETPNSKQLPEFQVPYYSPTIVSSTWSHGIDNQFDTPLANFILSIPDYRMNTGNFPVKIAVAAGDDMDFHQFIGPPPVINLGDLLISDRVLHYPATGFTPTQKIGIVPNPENRRTDLAASSYIPVDYSALIVQNNASGGSCPPAPTASIAFINDSPVFEGKSLIPEVRLTREGIPILNDKPRRRTKKEVVYTYSDGEDSEGHDTVDNNQSGSRSRRSVPSFKADTCPNLSDYYYE
uniref:Putative structural polyprotein n=1 Tax=Anoplolepis gracilipes virus 2 TaxID=2804527 RepID=A0A7U0FXA9_9VIRU|nr:putative structural polyprotein [Anoplolepis gracilipes virus 2]